MFGFETPLIKFHIQCEEVSEKVRLVSHSVGFRGGQDNFSSILICFWVLFSPVFSSNRTQAASLSSVLICCYLLS